VSFFFFFKQKTAYEITYGDWSSDVCSSDLPSLTSLIKRIYLCLLIFQYLSQLNKSSFPTN